MIPVTKPFLPPRETYDKFLNSIWKRNWLTNNGPLVNELETRLKEYLGMEHLLFLGNGTIAIQIAIKALKLKGEIITTPFSYVATTSSIVWENCTPVFADIDKDSLNIDPAKIEAAITKKTSAILATHVYGNPCDVEAIQAIADKHKLKVIYDAAHAFGVTYKGKSIFEYGDISTTSFHATKLYHSIEGGAVFTKDPELLYRMEYMRNFGHNGTGEFDGVGINGKNSEFHAAMGLCNLQFIDDILQKRKADCERYDSRLRQPFFEHQKILDQADYNYSYYPILFESGDLCLKVYEEFKKKHEIYARRYFHPILTKLDYVKDTPMPISQDIAERVLCLPLFYQISSEEIDMISRILLRITKSNLVKK